MNWSRCITVVGAHAEGEIGRVITGGVLPIKGATMLERLKWLNEHGDQLRRFALFEPRGAAQMTVNLLLPPCDSAADAGFIPMQGDGSHAMSGSNAMCVTTVLLETGMIAAKEGINRVVLDTAAGLVSASADVEAGRVKSVSLDFFPSFAEHLNRQISVDGLGGLTVDIAFGGVYYVLVDASSLGLTIGPEAAKHMVELGNRILPAVVDQVRVEHPTVTDFNKVEFCMFTGIANASKRIFTNATIMPPGRMDRSPCGTGTAARLAVMHARGDIHPGEEVIMQSTIGSRFTARIIGATKVGTRDAILPNITGRAWIYSIGQYGVAADDPFQTGFTLSDTWGDGIEHLIPTP